jgi:hypothetical protein
MAGGWKSSGTVRPWSKVLLARQLTHVPSTAKAGKLPNHPNSTKVSPPRKRASMPITLLAALGKPFR